MSKLHSPSEHPLTRLFDAAGLTTNVGPTRRANLLSLLTETARTAVLKAALEPRNRRHAVVGGALWCAWQTRTGDREWASQAQFDVLAPAARKPWLALGAAVMTALVEEVFA